MCKSNKQPLISLIAWLTVLVGLSQAQVEHRKYQVLVDGKDAGSLTATYTTENAESTRIEMRSCITCRVLLFKYTYAIHAIEVWSRGSVAVVESKVNDNGSQTQLSLRSNRTGQHLQVNKADWQTATCAATTTLVMQPNIESSSSLRILEVDSGNVLETTWEYQGEAVLEVGRQTLSCQHLKVAGGLSADLWFDDQRRLVKQIVRDSGYEITIQQNR